MNQPMNEPCDNDQPDTQATPAGSRPGRVLARPEPGETTSGNHKFGSQGTPLDDLAALWVITSPLGHDALLGADGLG